MAIKFAFDKFGWRRSLIAKGDNLFAILAGSESSSMIAHTVEKCIMPVVQQRDRIIPLTLVDL